MGPNHFRLRRSSVRPDMASIVTVVKVTQKVADWIEDSLTVEATAEKFSDPANGIEKQMKGDYTLNGADGTITVEGARS